MFVKPEAIPAATPNPFNSHNNGGSGMAGTASRSSRGAQSFNNRKKSRVESGLVSSLEVHYISTALT
jgi:hypothetical protein